MVTFLRTTPLPFSHSLTVVDNASTDGSREFLASCPDVTALCNGENQGYGRPINRGIAASRSKYLCLLNTDVILNAAALVALYRHLETHPRSGVAAPRICYPGGRTQGFIFCGGLVPLYSILAAKFLAKYHKLRVERARRPLQVDGVLGAFIFLNRELCPDGNLFDEDYFSTSRTPTWLIDLPSGACVATSLPDQSLVHLGGAFTTVRNGIQFYRSKYLYVRKQFGATCFRAAPLERLRIGRKVLFYRLLKTVYPSQSVVTKLDLYRSIWRLFGTLGTQRGSGS